MLRRFWSLRVRKAISIGSNHYRYVIGNVIRPSCQDKDRRVTKWLRAGLLAWGHLSDANSVRCAQGQSALRHKMTNLRPGLRRNQAAPKVRSHVIACLTAVPIVRGLKHEGWQAGINRQKSRICLLISEKIPNLAEEGSLMPEMSVW